MSALTRPCLACEGTGSSQPDCYECVVKMGLRWEHQDDPMHVCGGRRCLSLCAFRHPHCPVCLGSGRVEAKPSVRDAVADAETLREYVALRARRESDYMRVNMLFGYPAPETARYYDVKEAGIVLADGWNGIAYAIDVNTKRGVYCARAAFRAVPGLRG